MDSTFLVEQQRASERGALFQQERLELLPRQVRRVGLLDRLALHVGVALVAWSRRPRLLATHGVRADQLRVHRDTFVREREAERMLYLGTPWR